MSEKRSPNLFITTFGRELHVRAWTASSSAKMPSRGTPTQTLKAIAFRSWSREWSRCCHTRRTPSFNALPYHHKHNYKAGESGVRLTYFESEVGLFGRTENDNNCVWAEMHELNNFKNEVALLYLVGGASNMYWAKTIISHICETMHSATVPRARASQCRLRVYGHTSAPHA